MLDIFFGKNKNSSVTINGTTYQGANVTINGDKVIIDGKVQGSAEQKVISVVINGDVESVKTTAGDVEVVGNVGSINSTSGDITVNQNVNGNINTVSGDVDINGSQTGRINTVSGDIKSRGPRDSNNSEERKSSTIYNL